MILRYWSTIRSKILRRNQVQVTRINWDCKVDADYILWCLSGRDANNKKLSYCDSEIPRNLRKVAMIQDNKILEYLDNNVLRYWDICTMRN